MCVTLTAMSAEHPSFSIDWSGVDAVQPHLVNQILTQIGMPAGGTPEGIYVTLGSITPPIIFGNEDLQREQEAAYGGRLKVSPVCRFMLSRARAEEMIDLLRNAITQYDEATEKATHA